MDQDNHSIIYIDNWNDICRLCLRNDVPLQNFFYEKSLLDNIKEVTNLNVYQYYLYILFCLIYDFVL